jgi:uncharacterized membrane protein YdjX (TVP38/TMEM64 family)
MSRNGWIFVAVIVVMTAASLLLPVRDWMMEVVVWLRAQGDPGMWAFAVFYAVASVIMLPMFPLGVLAGMVYGVATGWLLLVPGLLLGSALAVVLGRTLLRATLLKMMKRRPKWRAVFDTFSERGFRVVALARMVPVMPFGVQNYLLGASGVSVRDMVTGTAVAMQPAIFLALYLGTMIEDLSQLDSPRYLWSKLLVMAVGVVAILVFAWWVRRILRKAE